MEKLIHLNESSNRHSSSEMMSMLTTSFHSQWKGHLGAQNDYKNKLFKKYIHSKVNHIRGPCSRRSIVFCGSRSGSLQGSHVLLTNFKVISRPVVSFPYWLPHKQSHGFSVVLHRQSSDQCEYDWMNKKKTLTSSTQPSHSSI